MLNVPIRDAERPLCACHGIPMLWQADRRRPPGGRWECREKRRIYNQRRSAQRVAWVRAKEARDPVYRIAHELGKRRRKALKRMAARHLPRED